MKKNKSKIYMMFLLAMMFAAPGLTAYLVYLHPNWLSAATINKGTLLSPPVVLKELGDHAKWRIVLWSPDACEKNCLQQLDKVARIRLALGRRLYQVDQWLILGSQAPALSDEAQALLKAQDFQVAQLAATESNSLLNKSTQTPLFIANPDKYLILSYKAQVNPDDVYKDLKLLLSTSENKSG